MPFGSRALGLVLALTAIPQSSRTVLGRCAISSEPVSRYSLPDALVEVSGLSRGPGGTLLTHGDEHGSVIVLDGTTLKPLREVRLQGDPRGDFEGIAAAGDSVVLMTSAGTLYFFRLGAANIVPYTTIATGLGRNCELEGLGWHRPSGTLILPCKQLRGQAAVGLTLQRYRLGRTPGPAAPIVVSGVELARVTGLALIRATYVEVDSLSGNLVVLSSKPPLVLEVDMSGRVLGMKRLPAQYHPQAEGLTLSSDALWIADEGVARKGTLARYSCR